jgi:hypothetical protein
LVRRSVAAYDPELEEAALELATSGKFAALPPAGAPPDDR